MDATVNDFFNEINGIGAKKDNKKEQETGVWQECKDERTGFPYYWNTVTDEVTWTKPKTFREVKTPKRPKSPEKKSAELFLPPASVVHPTPSPKQVKIYSLQEKEQMPVYSLQQNLKTNKPTSKPQSNTKPEKKPFRRNSGSDDEKIELITSYGGDSESESEKEEEKPIEKVEKRLLPQSRDESDEDEEDLLAKIQKRAKELKALGGDVPPEVKKIIEKPAAEVNHSKTIKSIAGFSLVGAYSDSEEEDDQELKAVMTPKPAPLMVFNPTAGPPTVFNPMAAPPADLDPLLPESGLSTLFPITKPVDVNDFIGPKPPDEKPVQQHQSEEKHKEDPVDSKAFQRKRRIGVSLMNSKKIKEDVQNGQVEHKGFGFKSETDMTETTCSTDNKGSLYSGFQKGGVMFVKSDILHPNTSDHSSTNDSSTQSHKKPENILPPDLDDDIEAVFKKAEAEDTYNMIKEKLSFLGEGRPLVLPVQVMLIQAETLFTAMKQNGLNVTYLQNWLQTTGTELVSLEKQAAPEGWLLQWDRSHKRYYYQNELTGETQWQYPEPDVDRCDEAMDICTTPPPPPVAEPPQPVQIVGPPLPDPVTVDPPLPRYFIKAPPPPPPPSMKAPPPPPPPSPPRIRQPSPPPAPVISSENSMISTVVTRTVPLPPSPPVSIYSMDDNAEPLPPGVDFPDAPLFSTQEPEPAPTGGADFSSVLDSFYSEIAEATTDSQSPGMPYIEEQQTEAIIPTVEDPPKKKKKKIAGSNVKTAGLSLKKKGVSELVQKWKSVNF